jgi:hypothetical protein
MVCDCGWLGRPVPSKLVLRLIVVYLVMQLSDKLLASYMDGHA